MSSINMQPYMTQRWNHVSYKKPPENELIKVIELTTEKVKYVVWKAQGGMGFKALVSRPYFMDGKAVKFLYWKTIKIKKSAPIAINQKLQAIKEAQGF